MKMILIPTDFSASATNAVWYAAALAAHTASKLILMHAIVPEVIKIPGNPFVLKADTRLENYYLDKLQILARQIQLQTNSSFEIETVCVPGPFPDPLHDLIRSKHVDLVIMGAKGAHNLLEKVMGTHTASCIKNAICPVLAVPSDVSYREIKNIAYASDFEQKDISFLKQLFTFAEPLQSAITIFNIKSEEQLDLVSDQQILRDINKYFPDKNFAFVQMKENNVVTGMEAFVRDNNMDILALPVYPPDLIETIFHTSVSQRLAAHSLVPLLALPLKPYYSGKTASNRSRQSQKNQ